MKTKPDLGIKNPYALDDKQLQAAVDLLKQQKANISEYWSDYLKEVQSFKSGNSVIGTTWQVIVNTAQGEKAPVKAIIPGEGATGWSDTWMVAAKSKHPNCAYLWMNWIVSPKANAQVAEYLAFALSFDEIIVTRFTASQTTTTLPIWILDNLFRPNQAPVVNVVATVLVIGSIIPIYIAQRLSGDPSGGRV